MLRQFSECAKRREEQPQPGERQPERPDGDCGLQADSIPEEAAEERPNRARFLGEKQLAGMHASHLPPWHHCLLQALDLHVPAGEAEPTQEEREAEENRTHRRVRDQREE